jgi:hypothetical protein
MTSRRPTADRGKDDGGRMGKDEEGIRSSGVGRDKEGRGQTRKTGRDC